jgi:hypothetical protein
MFLGIVYYISQREKSLNNLQNNYNGGFIDKLPKIDIFHEALFYVIKKSNITF